MSRRLALTFAFLSLLLLGAWQVHSPSKPYKISILKASSHEHGPRRTAKLSGPLNIRIDLRSPVPKQVGDTYKVVAVVSSEENLGSVQLKWILGPTTDIVSGAKEEVVSLVAHEEKEVELNLRAKSAGPQRVQVRATSLDANSRFSISAHFNSQPSERDFRSKKDRLEAGEDVDSSQQQKLFH